MYRRVGWSTVIGLCLVVAVFTVLSLLVTAIGTARFAVAMGYDARIGYVVGAAFEIAKEVLPVVLFALLGQRAFGTASLLGIAWFCLAAFSCLATHATVGSAISSIERTGTWKMEVRDNTKAELSSVEQQLAALSRPTPPRPIKTLREALAGASVPAGIWKDSHECAHIQESAYFMRMCAQVVQLRKELAAARDHERLSLRATELRKGVAEAPILAIADPLPAAFNATLGRFLPVAGTEGVALLLTIVVELISCVGLGGIAVLYNTHKQREGGATPAIGSFTATGSEFGETGREAAFRSRLSALPKPSLSTREASPSSLASGAGKARRPGKGPHSTQTSFLCGCALPQGGLSREGAAAQTATLPSHVPDFVQQRLEKVAGMSLGATELRRAYEAWCEPRGYQPLTSPKFAAELKGLGFDKWKSSGLIRYRDLQLVA